MNQLCRVQILTQTETRLEYVKKSSFVIGRADGADVVIADAAVSGGHFGVKIVDNEIFIADLDSRNGTWIGPTKLEPNQLTRCTGEAVHFGSTGTTINFELVNADLHGSTPPTKLPPLPMQVAVGIKVPPPPNRPPIPVSAPIPAAAPMAFPKSETVTVVMSEIHRAGQAEIAAGEKAARQKADELVAHAKNDALKESEKILAEAHLKIKKIKTDWEADVKNRTDLETKKLNDLKVEAEQNAERRAEKIILEATNEADELKKSTEKSITETQSKAKLAIDKINATAKTEAEARLAEARKEVEKIKIESQNIRDSIDKQKKQVELLQNETRKATEAQLQTAKAEEARVLKNHEIQKMKLADELEKFKQQLTVLNNDKARLATENKRLEDKITAANLKLKDTDEEFVATEAEYKEKISSLEKKFKAAQTLIKKKTLETESQLSTSRKTVEDAAAIEKDLKNLRDQREKLLSSIEDLKKVSLSTEAHKPVASNSELVLRTPGQSRFKKVMSAGLGLAVVLGAIIAWKHDVLPVNKLKLGIAIPQIKTVETRKPAANRQEKEIPVVAAAPAPAPVSVPAPAPVITAPRPEVAAPVADNTTARAEIALPVPAVSHHVPSAAKVVSASAPAAPVKMKRVIAEVQTLPAPAPKKPKKIVKDIAPPPAQDPSDPRQKDMDQLTFSDK